MLKKYIECTKWLLGNTRSHRGNNFCSSLLFVKYILFFKAPLLFSMNVNNNIKDFERKIS